jgi:hypothetical protein
MAQSAHRLTRPMNTLTRAAICPLASAPHLHVHAESPSPVRRRFAEYPVRVAPVTPGLFSSECNAFGKRANSYRNHFLYGWSAPFLACRYCLKEAALSPGRN